MKKKQYEVLQWASSYLTRYNREAGVAELLLEHHLGLSRNAYFLNMQEYIPPDVVERFEEDIKEHAYKGVPVQHLMGKAPFYGREFAVNSSVLVPRYDTEELVFHVIELVKDNFAGEEITLVDVGTGSGVIAITLALELENVQVFAVDISAEALLVAKKNAQQLGARVNFLQGDFLSPIIQGKLNPHIVISNPPYIKLTDEALLADTVVKFDPHLALFGGDDGLNAYRKITAQTKELPVNPYRRICYEIGYDQAAEVTEIIERNYPDSDIVCLQDMNQHDRIISAKI